ncbi:MAG: ISAs1 family transposase [Pseudonocardiaceae bacterium]
MLGALGVRIDPRDGRFVVPSESTVRRTLQAYDGDLLDAVLGAWLYPRLPAEQVIVDGKTLRGARAGDGRAVHVLAAMLAGTRTVIAQREIARETNEITAFAPLLDWLDLTGVLVSADALHTPRAHARFLIEDKDADYLLTIKGNQPSYVRDVTFAEDASRTRTRSGPRIMASLRNLAIAANIAQGLRWASYKHPLTLLGIA